MENNFNLLNGDEPLCLFLNEGITASKQMFAYSRPKSFADTQDSQRNEMFVSAFLFHEYASTIVSFLKNALYFSSEYDLTKDGVWRSFAEKQRLKAIQQGYILSTDCDEGGYIITGNIPDRVLEPYVIRHYLCPSDTSEIVLNTDPFDIRKFCNLLISFTEKNLVRKNEEKYGIKHLEKDKNGSTTELSDDEVSMRNAIKAADLHLFRGKIIAVAIQINILISKINNLPPFKDNKDEILDIEEMTQNILNMDESLGFDLTADAMNKFVDNYLDKPSEKGNKRNKTEE